MIKKIAISVGLGLFGLTTLSGCDDYPDQVKLDSSSYRTAKETALIADKIELVAIDNDDLEDWAFDLAEWSEKISKKLKTTDDPNSVYRESAKEMISGGFGDAIYPGSEDLKIRDYLSRDNLLADMIAESKATEASAKAKIKKNEAVLESLKEVQQVSNTAKEKLNAILKPYNDKIEARKLDEAKAQELMNTELTKLNPLNYNIRSFDIRFSWYNIRDKQKPNCDVKIKRSRSGYSDYQGLMTFPAFKAEKGQWICAYMKPVGAGHDAQAKFKTDINSQGINKAIETYMHAAVLKQEDTSYLKHERKSREKQEDGLKAQINLMTRHERRQWENAERNISSAKHEIEDVRNFMSDENLERVYSKKLGRAVDDLMDFYAVYKLIEGHDVIHFGPDATAELTGDDQYLVVNYLKPNHPRLGLVVSKTFDKKEYMVIEPNRRDQFYSSVKRVLGSYVNKS